MSKSMRRDRHAKKKATRPTHTHTHTHTGFKRKTVTLRLTGERQRGKLLVYVWGREVWFAVREFRAFCKLARARRESRTGYVEIDKLLICLLRAAIDKQTGKPGLGQKLIETGNYHEYRLCDEAKDFVTDPSFDELPHGVVDPELHRALRSDAAIDTPAKPR